MQLSKTNKKSINGVTLISLVITIIILLILAGISIAMLTGENGILTKATTAKEKTEQAEIDEKVRLAVSTARNNNGNFDKSLLITELDNYGLTYTDNTEDDNIIIQAGNNTYTINSNGEIIEENNTTAGGTNTPSESETPVESGNISNSSSIIKNIDFQINSYSTRSIEITTNTTFNNSYTDDDIATYLYVFNDNIKFVSNEKTVTIDSLTPNQTYSIYVIGIDITTEMAKSTKKEITTLSIPAYISEINNISESNGYYEIVPDILTSNSSSSYVTVSASSEYRTQSQAYMAFRNQDYVGWGSQSERAWLKLCFNTENKPIVQKIKFIASTLGSYIGSSSSDHWQIDSLTFEASNDDNNWTVLTTLTTVNSGTYPTIEAEINNNTAYKYYRFYNTTTGFSGLSNVHLYTK